jgi:hypothetical protein
MVKYHPYEAFGDMDDVEIYAVAALFTSFVGAAGFVILRFTELSLIGLLLLGSGAFLTLVFTAMTIYQARGGFSSSTAEPASSVDTGDAPTIRERLPEFEPGALARATAYTIAAFTLAGFGIGVTGALAIGELGGGAGTFLGGLLILFVLAAAFIVGPVVGLATGLGIADGPLDGFLGAAVGFIVMMAIILLLLGAATSTSALSGTTADGGDYGSSESTAFDEPASTPTPTPQDPETGSTLLEFLWTIFLFSIPTGIVGGGAAVLTSRAS